MNGSCVYNLICPFPEKSLPSILQEKLASPDEEVLDATASPTALVSALVLFLFCPLHAKNKSDVDKKSRQ